MGATLVISGRNGERLEDTLSRLEGESHVKVEADLSSPQGVEGLIAAVPGSLDGVVHCVGILKLKPFRLYSFEDIREIMNINFDTSAFLTGLLLRKKVISNEGSIVFISSISGLLISTVGNAVYSASKGAMNGLMKGLALELAPRGIRANCINPGMVDTGLFSTAISQEQHEEDVARYPLGRYGKPEEIAWATIYLLSDASRWVTGTTLVMDGGLTLK